MSFTKAISKCVTYNCAETLRRYPLCEMFWNHHLCKSNISINTWLSQTTSVPRKKVLFLGSIIRLRCRHFHCIIFYTFWPNLQMDYYISYFKTHFGNLEIGGGISAIANLVLVFLRYCGIFVSQVHPYFIPRIYWN